MATSEFIETGFGTNPSAQVVSESDLVSLGFYEQNGVDYSRQTMTPEAAVRIGKALVRAGQNIIGHRIIREGSGGIE
jgi:hypothetical protein